MKKMSVVNRLLGLMLLVASGAVWAHSDLVASVPAADAQVSSSPEQLQVTFGQPVRLLRLRVLNSQGEKLDIGFQPSAAADKTHSHTLPTLTDGVYRVEWGAMAADGHTMSGDFDFAVATQPAAE